jgi:hypothetical protein
MIEFFSTLVRLTRAIVGLGGGIPSSVPSSSWSFSRYLAGRSFTPWKKGGA